jgi:hypothetical protein
MMTRLRVLSILSLAVEDAAGRSLPSAGDWMTVDDLDVWADYYLIARAAWEAAAAERAACPADVWPTPRTVVEWANRRIAS